MRISYSLEGIRFEWGSEKEAENFSKHGIFFKTAAKCFFDPFLKYLGDEVRDNEVREKFIGMTTNWRLLIVVYTMREGDIYRIISARSATKRERKDYEK